MIIVASSNPYDMQLGDTAVNHTKVYNLVDLAYDSVAILGVSPRVIATIGLVTSLSFLLVGFSLYTFNREKLGSIAVFLSLATGVVLFSISASTGTEQEALKIHTQEIHEEILRENNYDMNHYFASEVRKFGDDGKEVRWKDIRTGKVVFFTVHAHSSHVGGISITSFDGKDIASYQK